MKMDMDQEISGIGKRLASDRKISAILEAAEFEFACNGYEGTTIQSIADRAKMTKRQVLYFFTNKKTLYSEVLTRIFKHWRSEEFNMWPGQPVEIFEEYMEHLLEQARTNPTHNKFMINEMLRGAPTFKENRSQRDVLKLTNRRIQRIQEWVDQGRIRDLDPKFFLFFLWSMQHFFVVFEPEVAFFLEKEKLSESDWSDIKDQMKQFVRILLVPDSKRESK
jgi:TetR/AcrR family transcriptional regulator